MGFPFPQVDVRLIKSRAAYKAMYIRVLALFILLASISTFWMWHYVGVSVFVQIMGIIIVAFTGESFVSAQGYYQYEKKTDNGPFIRNVPIWIPFLWIFSIQTAFLAGLIFGLSGLESCIFSGLLAVSFDFYFLEPYFSRQKGLWIWTSVENGYFKFIPKELNRFIAPPGNYIVWLVFPVLINYGTVLISTIF